MGRTTPMDSAIRTKIAAMQAISASGYATFDGMAIGEYSPTCSTDNFLYLVLQDVAETIGTDFLISADPKLLEQFALCSVIRNEKTGLLLKSLVTSFMLAYASSGTSEDAVQILLQLEALARDVASSEKILA